MIDLNEKQPLPAICGTINTSFSTWCRHHFKLVFVRRYEDQPPRYRLRCPMCLDADDPGRMGVQHQDAIQKHGRVRVDNALDYDWFCGLSDDDRRSVFRQTWRSIRYQEHLQSDKWRAIRDEVMDRHAQQCAHCGALAEHVHHLTYARLGDELPSDLIPLCAPCHHKEHGRVF